MPLTQSDLSWTIILSGIRFSVIQRIDTKKKCCKESGLHAQNFVNYSRPIANINGDQNDILISISTT